MSAPPRELSSAILASLLAYPEEDTAVAIAAREGVAAGEIEAILLQLKRGRLVRRWETHWQLTTTGSAEAAELSD
jgi:hypothetical protein